LFNAVICYLSGASVPGICVRDVKCGPEGFARRNASPMQGDQGAAVPGVGGPNPKNFRKWRGPFLNGFLSGIDRYRSANQKGLKWRKRE
jgi:hypothetical protein